MPFCGSRSLYEREARGNWTFGTMKVHRWLLTSDYCFYRQADTKLCAAGIALDLNAPLVPVHNAPDDVQPEACSFADRFGSEERIENPSLDIRRNSCPVVGNAYDNSMLVPTLPPR